MLPYMYLHYSANDNGSFTNGVATKAQLPTTTQPSAAFDLLGLNSVNTLSPSTNFDSTSMAQKLPPAPSSNGSTKLSSQLDLLCIGGRPSIALPRHIENSIFWVKLNFSGGVHVPALGILPNILIV